MFSLCRMRRFWRTTRAVRAAGGRWSLSSCKDSARRNGLSSGSAGPVRCKVSRQHNTRTSINSDQTPQCINSVLGANKILVVETHWAPAVVKSREHTANLRLRKGYVCAPLAVCETCGLRFQGLRRLRAFIFIRKTYAYPGTCRLLAVY